MKNYFLLMTTLTLSIMGCQKPELDTGCIDLKSIDPNLNCIQVYDPVCGCDGVTYSNGCIADKNGVKSYTQGACESHQ